MIENNIQKINEIIGLSDREEAYYKLVDLYIKCSPQEREQIRKDWDYGVKWIYPNPRRLACSKNEKRSCRERILASLLYDSIQNLRYGDIRESLIGLAMLYHSCIIAKLNPREEFEYVASISSPQVEEFFLGFINRKPNEKSMKAFCLATKINSDGETELLAPWDKPVQYKNSSDGKMLNDGRRK